MLKKADLILVIAFLLLTLAAALWSKSYFAGAAGKTVVVSVGGKTLGEYPLTEDRLIEIGSEGIRSARMEDLLSSQNGGEAFKGEAGEVTNFLMIEGGKAYMAEANCRDQYCVRHAAISKANEEIICLPNRVTVRVEGGSSEVDAVA